MNDQDTSTPFYSNDPKMFRANPVGFVFLVLLIPLGFGLMTIMPQGAAVVGLVPSVIGLLALGAWWLGTYSNRLTVTERHIRHRRGILSKSVKEIALHKVRAVDVYQSFIHRMTGVGRVSIYTTGDVPEIVLGGLPEPDRIKEAIANINHQFGEQTR